jgi:hypothetical protein
MTFHRLAAFLLGLAALATPGRADYLYSVQFDPTPVSDTTVLNFRTSSLFTGILMLTAPLVDLVSPPFPGAAVLSDVDTFRIDSSPGVLVVTLGTVQPQAKILAFSATFAPLTAVGSYPFTSAEVDSYTTGAKLADTTGFILISQPLYNVNSTEL